MYFSYSYPNKPLRSKELGEMDAEVEFAQLRETNKIGSFTLYRFQALMLCPDIRSWNTIHKWKRQQVRGSIQALSNKEKRRQIEVRVMKEKKRPNLWRKRTSCAVWFCHLTLQSCCLETHALLVKLQESLGSIMCLVQSAPCKYHS